MRCTMPDIIAVVAREFNMPPSQILQRTRHHNIARPRQVVMWIARHATKLSLPDIGLRLGGFDHTTVIHGVKVVTKEMSEDSAFDAKVKRLASMALARAAERYARTGQTVPINEQVAPA